MEKQEQLLPGQKVCYEGGGRKEYGIVIHSWYNPEINTYDCYIIFFGEAFPKNEELKEEPYILRYACQSLRKVTDDEI